MCSCPAIRSCARYSFCRAATLLLIYHGHWLTNRQFIGHCVAIEDDAYWVDWWQVRELLEADRLTGTNSELALLRFAVQLANDSLGMGSLDRVSRQLCVDALAHALGVTP